MFLFDLLIGVNETGNIRTCCCCIASLLRLAKRLCCMDAGLRPASGLVSRLLLLLPLVVPLPPLLPLLPASAGLGVVAVLAAGLAPPLEAAVVPLPAVSMLCPTADSTASPDGPAPGDSDRSPLLNPPMLLAPPLEVRKRRSAAARLSIYWAAN